VRNLLFGLPGPAQPTHRGNGFLVDNINLVAASVPDAPTNVIAVGGIGQATVSWTAPADNGSPITGYVVTPYMGSHALAPRTFNSPATTQQITGLRFPRRYGFKVTAVSIVGKGPQSVMSNIVALPDVPRPPTDVTARAANAKARVAWAEPTNGGSPITGYVVTPYIGDVPQVPQAFGPSPTVATVVGLTNGATYTFRVAAVNAVGTGPQSSPSNAVQPATVPDPPTIGIASGGHSQATVSWTAPAFDGGSPITGYVVTPYVAGVAQPAQVFNSTLTTQVVTGLTNGTTYKFKVAAFNAVGTGARSQSSNNATPH
jgi:hypothetical protein